MGRESCRLRKGKGRFTFSERRRRRSKLAAHGLRNRRRRAPIPLPRHPLRRRFTGAVLPARADQEHHRPPRRRRGARRGEGPRGWVGEDRPRAGEGELRLPRDQRRLLPRQPSGHRRRVGGAARAAGVHRHVGAGGGGAQEASRGDEAEGGAPGREGDQRRHG